MAHKLIFNRLIMLFFPLGLIISSCTQTQGSTPISLPTTTPSPNWHSIAAIQFEFWLPENFIGGSNLDIETIAQQMSELGPEFSKMAETLRVNKTSIIAFAFDTNKGNQGHITNMIATQEIASSNLTIEKYVNSVVDGLPEQYSVVSRDTLVSSRYSTELLILKSSIPQVGDLTQIMYAIRNGAGFWQITFTTPTNEFQERLPVFEQITRSVTVPYVSESTTRQSNLISVVIGIGLMIIALFINSWQKQQKRAKEEVDIPTSKKTRRNSR